MATMTRTNERCPGCGTRLEMRYPGGDPENGPAALRCPNRCQDGEPCPFCPERYHEDLRPGPGEGREHDSWGIEGEYEYVPENDVNDWDAAYRPGPEGEWAVSILGPMRAEWHPYPGEGPEVTDGDCYFSGRRVERHQVVNGACIKCGVLASEQDGAPVEWTYQGLDMAVQLVWNQTLIQPSPAVRDKLTEAYQLLAEAREMIQQRQS